MPSPKPAQLGSFGRGFHLRNNVEIARNMVWSLDLPSNPGFREIGFARTIFAMRRSRPRAALPFREFVERRPPDAIPFGFVRPRFRLSKFRLIRRKAFGSGRLSKIRSPGDWLRSDIFRGKRDSSSPRRSWPSPEALFSASSARTFPLLLILPHYSRC